MEGSALQHQSKMSEIKGALRNHLRERPFDFYVAFLLFLVGLYSVVSDTWPENVAPDFVKATITIVSLYLMAASMLIMSSLICNRKRMPVFSLMGEMYGWMAVSAAAFSTVFLYVGAIVYGDSDNIKIALLLLIGWVGLFVSSSARFIDLMHVYRSIKR